MRELKNLLYKLYLEANSPVLEDIAKWTSGSESPLTKTTISHYLSSSAVPAQQGATMTLATSLARHGVRDPEGVARETRRLWLLASDWQPLGTLIDSLDQERDPFTLEVHRSIDVSAVGALPALTPYIQRVHDDRLLEQISTAASGRSTIAVLVGGSSTGKTRACWEALTAAREREALLTGWRVWHPFDPSPADALLAGLDDVTPRTVLWLNELQHYLITDGDDRGERAAARLRSLLDDPSRAPVIVLGTVWHEYWDTLTRPVGRDHTQARLLLEGKSIVVPETCSATVIEQLSVVATPDPRLASAVAHAADGELIQYLAAGPALVERYETAPPTAKAVVEAAMDVCRLGHTRQIPVELLRLAAPSYLTDRQWQRASASRGWFEDAIAYLEQPCHGAVAPLGEARERPGEAEFLPKQYILADYLEQLGRSVRRRHIVPDALWDAAIQYAQDAESRFRLGESAVSRLLDEQGIQLLTDAAAAGSSEATEQLAKLYVIRNDLEAAIACLESHLERSGDEPPTGITRRLVTVLVEACEVYRLGQMADEGDDFAALSLARLLANRGDLQSLSRRARAGDDRARERYAHLLAKDGDEEQLRLEVQAGNPHAERQLAGLLAEKGLLDEAVSLLQTCAARDDLFATSRLSELLAQLGDMPGAVAALQSSESEFGRERQYAELLLAQDDRDGLRRRVRAGDQEAAWHLAFVLCKEGDFEGAIATLHALGEASGSLGMAWLGERLVALLVDLDQVGVASRVADETAESGNMAAFRLADVLARKGDQDSLRMRSTNGDRDAAQRLVSLLERQGDVEGAIAVAEEWADRGDGFAAGQLASLLVKQRDVEKLTVRADTFGERHAKRALSGLLARMGNVDLLRERMLAGDHSSAIYLARALIGKAEFDQVHRLVGEHPKIFTSQAMVDLAELMIEAGKEDDAVRLLEAACGDQFGRGWTKLAEVYSRRSDFDALRAEALRGNTSAAVLLREQDEDVAERVKRWNTTNWTTPPPMARDIRRARER